MAKEILKITGMHCAACSARVEKVVGKMEGVEKVSVNLATEKATVFFDPDTVSLSSIVEKIEKTGYVAVSFTEMTVVDEDKLRKEKEIQALWDGSSSRRSCGPAPLYRHGADGSA